MRISEQKLLDGYHGISNGLDLISNLADGTVWWSYRNIDGAKVLDRDDAYYISLENDRTGRIQLGSRFTSAQLEAIGQSWVDAAYVCGDHT